MAWEYSTCFVEFIWLSVDLDHTYYEVYVFGIKWRTRTVCCACVCNARREFSRASKSEGGIGAKPKYFIELNGQHPYQTNFQLNLNYVNYAKCVHGKAS